MSPLSLSFNVLNERLQAQVWQGCWSALPFLDRGQGQITPLVCFASMLRGLLLCKPRRACFSRDGERCQPHARACVRATRTVQHGLNLSNARFISAHKDRYLSKQRFSKGYYHSAVVLTFEHVISGCGYDCEPGLKACCSHSKWILIKAALRAIKCKWKTG